MSKPTDFPTAEKQVLAAIESDPSLRDRLLKDGNSALAEIGVPVPEGLKIRFHENTMDTFHVALPPRVTELDEDQLESIGGMGNVGVTHSGGNK